VHVGAFRTESPRGCFTYWEWRPADLAGLVDVALAAGSYDQPHFNADFRELTGLSPRELLAARHPSAELFSKRALGGRAMRVA
jgi:hypothetical protein